MATFNGNVKTKTRVPLDQDKFSPNMGSLVGSGNQEDTFIHGKLNQKVTADITRMFLANESIVTIGNQDEKIMGNRTMMMLGNETETIIAGRKSTVVGMVTESYIAGQMTSCIGPYNRTDVAPVTWLCPTSSQINSGDLYECKWFKGGAYLLRNTNVAVDVSMRGTNTQFHIHQLSASQFETKLGVADTHACVTMNNIGGLSNFVGALRNHMNGTIAAIRMAEAQVGPEVSPPLELGAPPFD